MVEIATASAQEAQILHAFDRRLDISVGALQLAHVGRGVMCGHSVGCQFAHRPMNALNWSGPSPADAPACAQFETRSPNVSPWKTGRKSHGRGPYERYVSIGNPTGPLAA